MASDNKQRIQLSGWPFDANPDALCQCIGDLGQMRTSALESAASKTHIKYISKYLGGIHTKTIIAERPYIDKDFLRDYWAFLSDGVSIEEYRCIRLHFLIKNIHSKPPPRGKRVSWNGKIFMSFSRPNQILDPPAIISVLWYCL